MGEKFQLYAGLLRNDKWYNYAEVEELKGGALAVIDGEDKSSPYKLMNLIKHSVPKLYSEDDDEYVMKDYDYEDMVFEDGYKVAFRNMQLFTGEKYPIVDEFLFCTRCSTVGDERYTHKQESWLKLVEEGYIDEHYLTSPDQMRYKTVLPHGLEIDQPSLVDKGLYTVLQRKLLTFRDMIKISNMQIKSDADYIYALWDHQIEAIEGVSDKAITAMIKRKTAKSFSRKYFLKQEDIDAMREQQPVIGIDARERSVICSYCHNEIGGTLDMTNFFAFLSPKQKHRDPNTSRNMI